VWQMLHAYREGLWAGLIGICAAALPAFETALEQAHQACVPIAENEEDEERRCEEVMVGERIGNGQGEVDADG